MKINIVDLLPVFKKILNSEHQPNEYFKIGFFSILLLGSIIIDIIIMPITLLGLFLSKNTCDLRQEKVSTEE